MLVAAVAICCSAAVASGHSVEFWNSVAQHNFALPAGSDVESLAEELSGLLGSPDPRLRDDIAYLTLAAWIYEKRIVEPPVLRRLTSRWLDNLADHVGESGTNDVLRRSFSALTLSVVVARDNAAPFLTADEFKRIENAALAYLEAERDLRGYDPALGWIHSAAHTADLLKFVARSRYFETGDQSRVLDAFVRKCETAGVVFTHGEDERFARAVLSIVSRPDFDVSGFQTWTARIRPGGPMPSPPTLPSLASAQNRKNLLAKLDVLLSLDLQPSPPVQTARDSVRAAIKNLF